MIKYLYTRVINHLKSKRGLKMSSNTSVFDVAKYILHKNGPMSTMKLQKLCYYCQAWSLVWDENELFPEEFQAWTNGPVCKELFVATQGKYKVDENDEPGNMDKILPEQKQTIDKVVSYYSVHDAQWLSELTHLEEPWKIARGDTPMGSKCHNIISKESMAIYYGGL